jgi:hypothetical protein
MTLRRLAAEVSEDISNLSKMEWGKRDMPEALLINIARVLNCPVNVLRSHHCPECGQEAGAHDDRDNPDAA